MKDAEAVDAVPPQAIARRARQAGRGPWLVLASVLSFGSRRLKNVSVVSLAQPTVELFHGYVARSSLAELVAALGPDTIQGGSDAVFVGRWSKAWAPTSEGLSVWTPEGLLARVVQGHLELGGRRFAAIDLEHVEVFVTTDWVRRGVRAVRRDEDPLEIASEEVPVEVAAHLDGLDLSQEILWAQALGRVLARALGLPFVDSRV
jgi:hypothetical protein